MTGGRLVVFFGHDITEILLKVALNAITLTPNPYIYYESPVFSSSDFKKEPLVFLLVLYKWDLTRYKFRHNLKYYKI